MPKLILVAAVLLAGQAAFAQYRIPEPEVSATRLLARAAVPQRDNSHLPLLMSLRQLRDPALEGFYRRLVQTPDWQVQSHAVLGLAEITGFDPFMIQRIDPRAQEHVIAFALDQDMIDAAAAQQLLAWPDLEPMARLLLVGEAILEDRPVDVESLRRLASSGNLQVAALASCMLAEVDDAGGLSAYRERLAGLTARDRAAHLAWLIEGIRQYELRKSLSLVREALDTPGLRRNITSAAVLTLLQLDPPEGIRQWQRFLDTADSYSHRVRFALLLATAADEVGPATFDLVPRDGELVGAITDAGRAIAGDGNPVPELCMLLDTGHVRSTGWVMIRANDLPVARAAAVYGHLIDSIAGEEAQNADRTSMAVSAVDGLFGVDEDVLIARLRAAEEGSMMQQVLLLGLFDSSSPRVADAVRGIARIGPRRTDSMALILLARHSDAVEADDLKQLSTIAAGGGRVSEMLQIQAAWLYLKHAGIAETSMTEIFTDS